MAISLHLGSSTSCSFLFRPACPPRSVPGLVWVIGPLARGASQTVEFYVLFLFFILFTPISTRSEPGAIWVSRILVLWQRTVIFCVRSVDVHFRPALSPLVCGGGTFVIVLVGTCSPRPPLLVTRRWFSLTVFPSLKDRPPFLPLVLPFLLGFVASPVRGVGVGSRRGLSEPLWLSLLRSRIAGQRCSSSTSTWSVHASNNKNLLNRRTSYGILLYICAPTWVTLHNASLRRVTALFSSWSRDVVLPWMTPPRFSARPIVI